MRALPFLATFFSLAPLAGANQELDHLQSRCAEMERQIRELELENSRLKSQGALSTRTVPVTAAPGVVESKPAPAAVKSTPSSSPAPAPKPLAPQVAHVSTVTVKPGDSLERIARNHKTTVATLVKLNGLKNPSLIRPGDKIRLPGTASPAATASTTRATAAPTPAAPARGTHIVKSGETFYSIARHYGLGVSTLHSANPEIAPERLRAGQVLSLGARSAAVARTPAAPAPAPVVKKEAPKPAPAPAAPAPVKQVQTAAQEKPAPAAEKPRFRLVKIESPIDFSAFAAAHGTSTEKLNALNGHNLTSNTVLGKGSEFYVPAQP